MKQKLSIVILNWNGKKYLHKFLPILLSHIPDYAEVVVADNASTDDSVKFLQEEFPHLRLIQNSSNGGFAKGYNLALQQINAEYYCLLNSDIEVSENWVEPVISIMDNDLKIGAVQPKLRGFDRHDFFEYAGASGGFIDKYGYPFCRGRLFESVEKDAGQYDDCIEIFWATGAALFVRSEIYHQLGGLDEDFFAHMEEIDFCWRIKNLGYKVMVQPKSVVYHVGGGTLPKQNSLKTFLNFRNNHFLLVKNLPNNRLLITGLMRFFLDIAAACLFLAKGNYKDFFAVFKAMGASVLRYGKMRKKRGNTPKDAYQNTCKKAIVFLYYIKNKRYFNGKQFL